MNNDEKFIEFVNKICQIDTTKYDNIYKLNDNWAGHILFIKGNTYRCVQCGSGKPIISEKKGMLM